ncbi:sarcosine oxidase subunit gamma family protein [Arthrobacter sp. CAU 1506]|uniref:sarcosine oxidase subunit gamma n=1 Tax=Arthrobacter sp. CAU 1506 TaxID=2560052 RepID=UPI0010AD0F21|nr:sarcosine oxidase subunit gamma family protein [Arthrobacter sp. CAU 1506]TJY67562.1 sarcosine oxidase subunit gamma family protein [Arthrobacter sp. CAU 1506]
MEQSEHKSTRTGEPVHLRRSPLAHLAEAIRGGEVAGERGVALREVPFLTMVGLRAEPGSAAAAALEAAAGAPLPGKVGQVTGDPDGTAVLWLGPDEYLLVAPDRSALATDLAAALGGEPGAVVDLSANRTTLELSGPSARRVLEKGCHADLHPRAFGPGTAVSTQLATVPVLLWQTAERHDGPVYRIMPRASFADFTARWLLDAMTEFAAPEVD